MKIKPVQPDSIVSQVNLDEVEIIHQQQQEVKEEDEFKDELDAELTETPQGKC
jgi:hypothetical protein